MGRGAYFFVVGYFLETGKEFAAGRKLFQIGVRYLVLGFYPGSRFAGGIVFEPAVRVRHLGSEIIVHCVVFARSGEFGRAGINRKSHYCHGDDKFSFHVCNIVILIEKPVENFFQPVFFNPIR